MKMVGGGGNVAFTGLLKKRSRRGFLDKVYGALRKSSLI